MTWLEGQVTKGEHAESWEVKGDAARRNDVAGCQMCLEQIPEQLGALAVSEPHYSYILELANLIACFHLGGTIFKWLTYYACLFRFFSSFPSVNIVGIQ